MKGVSWPKALETTFQGWLPVLVVTGLTLVVLDRKADDFTAAVERRAKTELVDVRHADPLSGGRCVLVVGLAPNVDAAARFSLPCGQRGTVQREAGSLGLVSNPRTVGYSLQRLVSAARRRAMIGFGRSRCSSPPVKRSLSSKRTTLLRLSKILLFRISSRNWRRFRIVDPLAPISRCPGHATTSDLVRTITAAAYPNPRPDSLPRRAG